MTFHAWATSIITAILTTGLVNAEEANKPIYFEAEWSHHVLLNYQIENDGQRTVLSSAEGADGAFAWNRRKHVQLDVGQAHYTVRVPEPGTYVLWAKHFWMDSCGNSLFVSLGNTPYQQCLNASDSRTDLFGKWQWSIISREYLPAGTATIKLKVCEDGPGFDAFALLPPGKKPNERERELSTPYFLEDPPLPFSVSISTPTIVVDDDNMLELNLYVRKLIKTMARGTVTVTPPGTITLKEKAESAFEFAEGEALKKVTFKLAFDESLPLGEHRLRISVKDDKGNVCGIRGLAILKPLDWRMLGLLPISEDPIDPVAFSESPAYGTWARYPSTGYDRFGTMDLEKAMGQSLGKSTYLYTEVESDSDQAMTLLCNNDDQAWVWMNGRLVYGDESMSPAIGGQVPHEITLNKGKTRILVRVTQSTQVHEGRENYWRFRMRFRTRANIRRAASVRGVALPAPNR